tara:strand:+ start:97 stop:291 length:195 start_codon:yes stop_codon:yes gene_type:complete
MNTHPMFFAMGFALREIMYGRRLICRSQGLFVLSVKQTSGGKLDNSRSETTHSRCRELNALTWS